MRKKMHHNNGMQQRGGKRKYNNNSGGKKSGRQAGAGGQGDSQHISPKLRRHAVNAREKYTNMARDARASGDRVEAEYYYQHADHYLRLINLADEQYQERKQSRESNKDHESDDNISDIEMVDEGEGATLDANTQEDEAPKRSKAKRPHKPKTAPAKSTGKTSEENNEGAQLEAILPAPKASEGDEHNATA